MKKNLRIVSAAAAALLAVAPVAAGVVPAASVASTQTVKAAENGKGDYVVGSVDTYKRNKTTNTFTAKTVDALKGATYANPIAVTFVQTVKSGDHNYNQYKLSNGDKFWAKEGRNGAVAGIASVVGSVKDGNISITLPKIKKAESVAKYKEAVLDAIAPNLYPKLGGQRPQNLEPQDVSVIKNGFPLDDSDEVKPGENYNVTLQFSYENSDTKPDVYVLVNGKVEDLGYNGGFQHVTYKVNANNGSTNGSNGSTTPAKPAKPSSDTPYSDTGKASPSIDAGSSSIFTADANTTVSVSATAKNGNMPSTVNGSVSVSYDGKTFNGLLHDVNGTNTDIYTFRKGEKVSASNLTAGHYIAAIKAVTVNMGNEYAGKNITLTLSHGVFYDNGTATKAVTVDNNGIAHLGTIEADFYAYDATNAEGVNFFNVKTGEVVKSGSVSLHAVNGKTNIQSLYAALTSAYGASQYIKGQGVESVMTTNDLRDQLKKQNITVDPDGSFTAPASFTVNMNAKSNNNGATATLPVTVTVDNVTPTAAQETTKTVKIMHIATIYDKNGKATHEPALRAYNTVSVVSEPVSLKDEKGNDAGKFYKLAGKDQYIKVGNVDGTKRTLKHNSYVYKSTGKRRGKTVLKKSSSVTTYGKSFMIAGHQMYRIGKNQYVKKANF